MKGKAILLSSEPEGPRLKPKNAMGRNSVSGPDSHEAGNDRCRLSIWSKHLIPGAITFY